VKSNKQRNRSFKARRPALTAETELELNAVRKLANQIDRGNGRFGFYKYLEAVYRLNRQWRRSGLDKVIAQRVARQLGLQRRKGSSSIRMIIDATYPAAGHGKQKSRWVRALEFAAAKKAPAPKLDELFRSNGGVAGCAAHASRLAPKKILSRDDWAPRPKKIFAGRVAAPCSERPTPAAQAQASDWYDSD
jgi:hypothetical protein